ncbi:alpha/beta-hydrolase [Ustulina deusta]|nr:alpha/beta-hydrolase [Ustulina deusta]
MSDTRESELADIELPRKLLRARENFIAGPGLASFTSRFGTAFPTPRFLESELGTTAVYSLAPPSGRPQRRVLLIHGLNTPALGLLPLAARLQALDGDAHVVLFDLWGHGLSGTPLVAHAAAIFHAQILQVLGFLRWPSAHLLGYSFGAAMLAKFALCNPWAVDSAALLAPAGVIDTALFGDRLRGLLLAAADRAGSEPEAREAVFAFLEGGPLVVPPDWEERARRGEVVAEALRDWELSEHPGYRHSVFSMFREGNVYGCEDDFGRFARLQGKKVVVVLGELDEVCRREKLVDLGFEYVEVVEGAGHGVVRTQPGEVARIVYGMWTR